MRLAAAANNAFQQASLLTTSSAQHITLPHARIGAGLVLSRERLFFLSRKMGIRLFAQYSRSYKSRSSK